MKSYTKIFKILGFFLTDSKYRNKILGLINYHTSTEVSIEEDDNENNDYQQIKNLKIHLIGGCELTYIKDHLNNLGAITKHTFDEGASSIPSAECENPNSSLWDFKPDIILMSNIQVFRGIIQKNQLETINYKREEQEKDIDMSISEYNLAINKIQKKLNSKFFLLSYPLKYRPTFGYHEYKSFKNNLSLIELIRSYELKLYELCKKNTNTFLLDVNLILETRGKLLTIRDSDADGIYEHFSKEGSIEIVKNLDKQLSLLDKSILRVKCVVFDLDNTLWNGILREDDVGGVDVRDNVLNIIRILASRGIIVAICSKNDPSEVQHLDSLLGEDVYNLIAVKKINWNPKSQNLKEISKQLNIGMDTLAFFDDSAFERNEVKTNAPQIRVFDETQILECLDMTQFVPFGEFSEDSITRVQKYKEQAFRQEAEKVIIEENRSYEEFLKDSNLILRIRRPKEGEISRVIELLQRTNQLNATLKRTELNELLNFYNNTKNFLIYSVFLEDKFGDYGMIGVCIVEKLEKHWNINEIAFSCRAMGRKIEYVLLLELIRTAYNNKMPLISIEVTVTDRNNQIIGILRESGFLESKEKSSSANLVLEVIINQPPKKVSEFASWLTIAS